MNSLGILASKESPLLGCPYNIQQASQKAQPCGLLTNSKFDVYLSQSLLPCCVFVSLAANTLVNDVPLLEASQKFIPSIIV